MLQADNFPWQQSQLKLKFLSSKKPFLLIAKVMLLINVVNDTCIWEPGLAKPSYEQLHCKTKKDLVFWQ